jgi:hypothetical protein
MNRIKQHIVFSFLAACTALVALQSCTKLDVVPVSTLTPANFPKTPAQFVAATGPIYTTFRGTPGRNLWLTLNLSTDENVLVARGGNWLDGGTYSTLNLHTYTPDNGIFEDDWTWGFSTIIHICGRKRCQRSNRSRNKNDAGHGLLLYDGPVW